MGREKGIAWNPDVTDGLQTFDQEWDTFFVESGQSCTAGDWVMTDVAGTTRGRGRSVKKGLNSGSSATAIALFRGIALQTITGPAEVRVATKSARGVVLSANIANAAVQGSPLTCSAATDGRLDVGTIGTHHIVGVTLVTPSSNVGDFVFAAS